MKKLKFVLTLCVSAFLFTSVVSAQSAKTGKDIFEVNKCNSCHSIKAEKIDAKSKSNAPDLSAVGSDVKSDFIQKFLKKEESLGGKKHPIAFKGTNDELATLANWLGSLKKK